MRTFSLLLIFGSLLLLLLACKDRERAATNGSSDGSNSTSENSTAPPEETSSPTSTVTSQISDSLVFSLERGACFGTCPFYQLHVYESGFATFNGIGHVPRIGMHHGQVSQEIIETLKRDAESFNFFEMEDEYDSPVTDIPSTTITVRRNGDTKRVKGRVDPPPAFKRFVDRAEELLLPIDWEPVEPQE